MTQEQTRTVVIGVQKNTKPNLSQVQYVSATKESKTSWIPDVCVASTQDVDNQTIYFLQDAELNGNTIRVAKLFSYSTDHAEVADIADTWIEFGELPSEDTTEDIVEEEADGIDPFADVDADGIDPFADVEADGIDPFASVEASDDTTPPAFEGHGIELSEVTEEEASEVQQAKKKMNAAQRAAALRKERYEAEKEVLDGLNTDMTKAMLTGKRHGDAVAWNFHAKVVDMAQYSKDPITGKEDVHVPRNPNTGTARVRCITNPTLADDDNPHGVILNRAIGENFEHIDHPTVFNPIIDAVEAMNQSAGKEIIAWDAVGINKGKRAVLNLDLTGLAEMQLSNVTRAGAAEGLSNFGYVNLSANRISDMLVEEQGGHRFGITIMNAHDGKSALQSFASFFRTYCGNLAMRGGVQNLLMAGGKKKIRHMKGSIAEYDADLFAERVTEALYDTYKTTLAFSILRHLPIETNMFDKILTVFNKQGLIEPPTVKVAAGDIQQIMNEQGKIELSLSDLGKDAIKVAGGQAYNSVVAGWMNPDLDYVALQTDADKMAEGTLFHAAQALTGTLTHNPIYISEDGKRTLHGKTQGVETMMKKSNKAVNMLENIAFNAVNKYASHTGQPVDDLEAMAQWYADNPHELEVPITSYKANSSGDWNPKTVALTDVPDFTSTWKTTVIAESA